jgi:hypothetical protein
MRRAGVIVRHVWCWFSGQRTYSLVDRQCRGGAIVGKGVSWSSNMRSKSSVATHTVREQAAHSPADLPDKPSG